MGREVESLLLRANESTLARLEPVLGDVLAAARILEHRCEAHAELEDGTFEVAEAVFAPKPQK